MSPAQILLLEKMATHPKGMPGPSPDYQGDCVHCSGPELGELVKRGLISVRATKPRDTDGNPHNPQYLRFTHRYKIRKAGVAALSQQNHTGGK